MSTKTTYSQHSVEKILKYISVNDARKIMGKNSKEISDDEIQRTIINLTTLVRFYMKSVPKC